VVLRSKGTSWRSKKAEGGGCLYDYAAHPANLLNWFFGMPRQVRGTALNSIFSKEIDDEVYSSFDYSGGLSAHLSVNWSDESFRKMSVKISISGTAGRIVTDRQECQVYLRGTEPIPDGYSKGWNVRYTTELTKPVWFYVRGEEYSAQLDYFVHSIESGSSENINSFAAAAQTDRLLAMMIEDAKSAQAVAASETKNNYCSTDIYVGKGH
jgi:predicted dehydrogenase